MAKETFSMMGWMGRTAAFCVVLAALLASGALLAAVAGPAGATFAGGNGKVAYYSNGDVWTMNADGTGVTKLTTNYNAESNPAVSPDGSRIIFESNRNGNGYPTELYSMPAGGSPDGSAITRLTNNSIWDSDADWSVSSPTCDVTGNGEITGTAGDDVICGGPNNDTIDGLGGSDVILGGAGNDTLVGASGRDTLNGGPGTDTASFAGSTAPVEASLTTGFAQRSGTSPPEGVALVGVENIVGSDLGDVLGGSAGANFLVGGKGADEILGLAGNDRLNSRDGARNDTVNGGGGNDRCVADAREAAIRGCE